MHPRIHQSQPIHRFRRLTHHKRRLHLVPKSWRMVCGGVPTVPLAQLMLAVIRVTSSTIRAVVGRRRSKTRIVFALPVGVLRLPMGMSRVEPASHRTASYLPAGRIDRLQKLKSYRRHGKQRFVQCGSAVTTARHFSTRHIPLMKRGW